MKRRRKRSAFGSRQQRPPWVLWGAVGVIVIGAFLFFMRQADELAPEPQEIRTALPDIVKE